MMLNVMSPVIKVCAINTCAVYSVMYKTGSQYPCSDKTE